jgi:hypothetical protein
LSSLVIRFVGMLSKMRDCAKSEVKTPDGRRQAWASR